MVDGILFGDNDVPGAQYAQMYLAVQYYLWMVGIDHYQAHQSFPSSISLQSHQHSLFENVIDQYVILQFWWFLHQMSQVLASLVSYLESTYLVQCSLDHH